MVFFSTKLTPPLTPNFYICWNWNVFLKASLTTLLTLILMMPWSPCNPQTAPCSPPPHCDNCHLCWCSQNWWNGLKRTIFKRIHKYIHSCTGVSRVTSLTRSHTDIIISFCLIHAICPINSSFYNMCYFWKKLLFVCKIRQDLLLLHYIIGNLN